MEARTLRLRAAVIRHRISKAPRISRTPLPRRATQRSKNSKGSLTTYLCFGGHACKLLLQWLPLRSSIIRRAKQSSTAQAAGGNVMDDVYKMYAMSDGEDDAEPAEVDHDEDMDDEDEEVETSSVLTSSDDDEGVPEETSVVISESPQPKPARKAPAKKAVKAPAKKAPAKKAAAPAKAAKKSVAKKSSGGTPKKAATKKQAKAIAKRGKPVAT